MDRHARPCSGHPHAAWSHGKPPAEPTTRLQDELDTWTSRFAIELRAGRPPRGGHERVMAVAHDLRKRGMTRIRGSCHTGETTEIGVGRARTMTFATGARVPQREADWWTTWPGRPVWHRVLCHPCHHKTPGGPGQTTTSAAGGASRPQPGRGAGGWRQTGLQGQPFGSGAALRRSPPTPSRLMGLQGRRVEW